MADIKNVVRSGSELTNLNDGKVGDRDIPNVQKTKADSSATKAPVGQPGESQRPGDGTNIKPGQGLLTEAITGKDVSQLEAGQKLSMLGGTSATDKLLGLDLRPTMLGLLVPPPGNSDFLRHISPTMRRTIMRNMLSRQRKRMRRLARFLRDERENQENDDERQENEESFLQVISEPMELDEGKLEKAISDLGRTARMLDVLDEMLAMQDYTISQIGTFSQG